VTEVYHIIEHIHTSL